MPDFHTIYRDRAEDYHLLVSREDYHGNIPGTLEELCPLAGADVVEFGAGTGRLTAILAPRVASIRAFDASEAMLAVARRELKEVANCTFGVGENEELPCEVNAADLSIAGWTFGHMTGWYPEDWRTRIGRALGEMRRVTRPGGAAVILETLGTGTGTPTPPTPALAAYYTLLEEEHGFIRHVIRTDYRFESVAEAERLTRFFFGDELADRVGKEKVTTLPECTGVWLALL